MSDLEFVEAVFTFPDINSKTLKGTLHITQNDKFFILNENPFNPHSWKTISIVYVQTPSESYSCVECLLYRSTLNKYYYTVTELYQGKFIDRSETKIFKSITTEIFFLTDWLSPKLFEVKTTKDENYFTTLKVRQSERYIFKLIEDKELLFEAYTSVKQSTDLISYTNNSMMKITSENNSCRQELFSLYYSFIIFYTLFVRSIPRTIDLIFTDNEDNDIRLLGLDNAPERNSFDILLRFKKIENFQSVIQKYFEKKNDYNLIIQLWQGSFKQNDPEVSFLHLTQGIEVFHRTFYQNDPNQKKAIATEVCQMFKTTKIFTEWNQIMVYYHLVKLTKSLKIEIAFPEDHPKFIKCLRSSRNFYTHHNEEKNIWSHFELFTINNFLKTWLRALLLSQLNVSLKNINSCIIQESRFLENDDIFKNEYSMRYQNNFTT